MKKHGICFVCGCVQNDACEEGCGWANVKKTLCTACKPLNEAARRTKRNERLRELVQRHEIMAEELRELEVRIEVLCPIKITPPKRRGSKQR
jgi:hypothetical protein